MCVNTCVCMYIHQSVWHLSAAHSQMCVSLQAEKKDKEKQVGFLIVTLPFTSSFCSEASAFLSLNLFRFPHIPL